jgi:hypothetical protein
MGTTLIIVELLIIGFQVLIWVALLLRHLGAIPNWPERLEGCHTLLIGFLVGTAYTLGIVSDRVVGHVSTIFQAGVRHVIDTRQSKSNSGTSEASVQERPPADEKAHIREFYAHHIYGPHAYDALENANRQIRLLRATCFNSFIIALMLSRWYPSKYKPLWRSLFILAFLSSATWIASYRMRENNLKHVYHAWQREQSTEASERESPEAPEEERFIPAHDDPKSTPATLPEGHTLTPPAIKPATPPAS